MNDQDILVFGILASMAFGVLVAVWLGLPKAIRARLVLQFGTLGGLLIASFVMLGRMIAWVFSSKE